MRKCIFCAVGLVLAVSLVAPASADTLEIQYTGLDIIYDGSVITDLGDPDPLESVDFLVNGTKVFGLNAGVDMSLSVPGVSNLPVGGGAVTSAAGGLLSLALPDGDFLDLQLGAAEVVYVSVSVVQLNFVLAAGSANVLGQLLPIEGELEDVVAISFSTNIDNNTLTDDGSYITGFEANGTGEIEGILVPEPSTICMLGIGALSLFLIRRKRNA
jgi:PEP-CTERM motif